MYALRPRAAYDQQRAQSWTYEDDNVRHAQAGVIDLQASWNAVNTRSMETEIAVHEVCFRC